jgi:hypothetical protein
MRTTLNLRPEAWQVIQSVSRNCRKSMGEAASDLILDGLAGKHNKITIRNGIPITPKTGIPVTDEEVNAALKDE